MSVAESLLQVHFRKVKRCDLETVVFEKYIIVLILRRTFFSEYFTFKGARGK